ncbi:uncharacterized protein LOC123300077 [Chrysoperla carnea]|uniref:uncharacterized protein LOC123300077 n=1 Tax=Chrysoperla carnea TaxID=189513 RepID=UPI001D07EB2D|nr:uncharacterized protein LOC123300077 [Chrysoperla carnea]
MPKPIRYMSKRRIYQMINDEINTSSRTKRICNHQTNYLIPTEENNSAETVNSISVVSTDTSYTGENGGHNVAEQNEDHQDEVDAGNIDLPIVDNRTEGLHELECVQFYREDVSTTANSLSEDLRFWLSENSISQKAASNLISIFRNHGHQDELKKDVRTLMKTPRDVTGKIIHGNGGSYFHFGISNGLIRSLNKYYDVNPDVILIQLNCDGMSFSKSSNSQFWPLLAAIEADFYTEPFLIGLFHGFSKPNDFNVYINPFVDEMKDLQNNGIMINNKTIDVRLNAIICDAPARAYLTLTKSHSGYFGCSKCIQEGEWDGYVNFPEINNPLRTDESFRNQQQEDYHLGESLLLDLDFDMVSQIPLDYQHLICLGVTKRLLLRWCNGPKNQRLSKDKLNAINETLQAIKVCIPTEFARQPRLLDTVAKWKATECRQFLLYTGPIILKTIMGPRKYNHFMALSVAIRGLCDTQKYLVYSDYADQLLRWFVEEYRKLYGSSSISYNVHNLIHLASDCKKFGPLDNFSTFKFENYMSTIKNKVKNAPKPLEQVVNRTHEENSLPVIKNIVRPNLEVEEKNDKIIALKFNGFTNHVTLKIYVFTL